MDGVRSILENWFLREPMAILWMVIAAALLFGMAFVRSRGEDDGRAWSWFRRLLESLLQAALFVGLLGMFYFLLNSDFSAFERVFGSFYIEGSKSNQAWQAERDAYGGALIQQDLSVTQYIPLEAEGVVQFEDPSGSGDLTEQPVSQASITGFHGSVTMDLKDGYYDSAKFNTYTLQADYLYDIVNPMDSETRAVFRFPLSTQTILFEDLEIRMDGEDITWLHDEAGAITWNSSMRPGEQKSVSIHYSAKGMEGFLFEVTDQRLVNNFELNLFMKNGAFGSYTEPENGGIQLIERAHDGLYQFIWTIDDSIVAPRLGVGYGQGWCYAPYHEMVVSLPYVAHAIILFLSLAVLTSLIFSAPLKIRHVALLAGLFSLPYLVLMAGGVPAPETIAPGEYAHFQVKMLPLLSVIPLVLAYYCLPKRPKSVLVLVLILMALYMAGYPFIGLEIDERKRNAIEGGIQVAMIAYVFALTLFVRMRNLPRKKQD